MTLSLRRRRQNTGTFKRHQMFMKKDVFCGTSQISDVPSHSIPALFASRIPLSYRKRQEVLGTSLTFHRKKSTSQRRWSQISGMYLKFDVKRFEKSLFFQWNVTYIWWSVGKGFLAKLVNEVCWKRWRQSSGT